MKVATIHIEDCYSCPFFDEDDERCSKDDGPTERIVDDIVIHPDCPLEDA